MRLSITMRHKLHQLDLRTRCYHFKRQRIQEFEGKEMVWTWQRESRDFPLTVNTMKCFSLNKLVLWSCRDFVTLWSGEKCEAVWKAALPACIFWAGDCIECHLPFSFAPLSVELGLTFPVCRCDMTHSSWHIYLVSLDRLEGLELQWVLLLLLPGQQASFQIAAPGLLCSGHSGSVPSLQCILHLTC